MPIPYGNITSANATLILTVDELYPSGVQLMNFGTDQMIGADDIEVAQARMGVDGGLAVGYTPNIFALTITLEACSPSLKVMQNIMHAMRLNMTTYKCKVSVSIPSISQMHIWSNGTLISGNPVPAPKKVLDPTTWKFAFSMYTTQNI